MFSSLGFAAPNIQTNSKHMHGQLVKKKLFITALFTLGGRFSCYDMLL